MDNGTLPTDKGKTTDKPGEDLKRSASNSPTHSALKGGKAFTVRYSDKFMGYFNLFHCYYIKMTY